MMTQDLLQDLVQSVHLSPASKILPLNQETVHEVVFESKVDGISYYLVRCQPTPKQLVSLSPREQAIAQLIAQGLPNKCIGKQLGISPWTVATHIRRIFQKLQVTSRSAMIARLLEARLLSTQPID